MSSFRGKYFLDALSAIERIGAAQSPAAIGEVINGTAASFGYDHVCFLISAGSHQPFEDRVLWQAWPKSWAEQYRSSNFYAHDPLAPRIRRQAEMFAWSDLPLDQMNAAARSIMEIAAVDYDLRFGLCAPVHGMNGYQAGLSLAGRDVDRTPEANSAIELVTMYAFNRFAILRSRQQTKTAVLSAREREVMNWVAAGKTAWDTSVILSISEDTVNKTVTAAMHKLNAHTRAQAVAEAIKRGLIAF
ncbi:LuxR family transcriptional regulator [Rhodopseudomonas boonkerdii]|uniref:LuxR family transcriptional regulator n=1 Tax=Rhodopseudomonas boonkerdii TaxID=475937 RepID=UPI001E5F6506|nr:LuxR family transcriptional regulator [Rhodopseudomonas boonkerdii]UGV26470.1 LuxR family transcriptional regulator [Rhodopseudomonas boonkerdii]